MNRSTKSRALLRIAPGVFFYWHAGRFHVGKAGDPFKTAAFTPEAARLLLHFTEPQNEKTVSGASLKKTLAFMKKEGYLISPRKHEEETEKSLGSPALRNFSGFDVARRLGSYPDLEHRDPEFRRYYRICQPYTFTSVPMAYALFSALKYIHDAEIPGDIVECGVWRGGSMMLAALTLKGLGNMDRGLFLFDTFDGTWDAPGKKDRLIYDEQPRFPRARGGKIRQDEELSRGLSLQDVGKNMQSTGYEKEKITLVPGLVQKTLPRQAPRKIALLRLDTDFYDSTFHALQALYPRLAHGGVLLIDDYGKFTGATQAVDDFLKKNGIHLLLHRVDLQGRIAIKP